MKCTKNEVNFRVHSGSVHIGQSLNDTSTWRNDEPQMTHDLDHVGANSQSESPIVGLKVDPSIVNTLTKFRTKRQIFHFRWRTLDTTHIQRFL
jgi:hypothetical protein